MLRLLVALALALPAASAGAAPLGAVATVAPLGWLGCLRYRQTWSFIVGKAMTALDEGQGLILILVISAEYYTADPTDRRYLAARLSLNAWAYVLALVVFILIYSAKARSLRHASSRSSVLLAKQKRSCDSPSAESA